MATDTPIDRRNVLSSLVGITVGGAALAACATEGSAEAAAGDQPRAQTVAHPILLYCDLKVDPRREQEMLDHFHNRFKPVGAKFKGFIDLKMVKLRTLIQGDALPTSVNYRFQLTYESEELRQIWIASPEHAEFWPGIENTLIDKNFHVSLWDDV